MDTPLPNAYWVVEGLLLAGEYPGGSGPDDTRERLSRFLDAGIRVFYDLTEPGELRPYDGILDELATERQLDVQYERVPIRNRDVPDRARARRLLASIGTNVDARLPCYVHCWGGIGRTGTIVGCWLVEREQLAAPDALARIGALRALTPHCRATSPETGGQCEFVSAWDSGRHRSGS
jgi:hypothetical protein